jgi:hypothetical protein
MIQATRRGVVTVVLTVKDDESCAQPVPISIGFVTERLRNPDADALLRSVTVNVTGIVASYPVAGGVPEIAPVDALSVAHAGSPVAEYAKGAVPLVWDTVPEYGSPSVAPVGTPLSWTVNACVARENDAEPVRPVASVTVTVMLDVPPSALPGVPDIAPVDTLMVIQAGWPLIVQAYGAVPPVTVGVPE